MIIGNFNYDKNSDTYSGEIKTLVAHHPVIQIVPVKKETKEGPQYRLVAATALGAVEFGSAWRRKSKGGNDYLSVSIDDPSLSRGFNAALTKAQEADNAILIWSRPTKK